MTPPTMADFFDVVIAGRRDEAPGVISLTLARPLGGPLPVWSPGAHVEVRLPSGLVRQYSLCGTSDDTYLVAALREVDGRGGSAELHAVAHPGVTLSIRGPRNQFPLVDAPGYLLLAGGIGITPILAMARQLAASGRSWRLCYGGRSRTTMAFVDELLALGGDVDIIPEDERGLLDLPSTLATVSPRTAIYCCGPPPMINATQRCCAELGLDANLHVERFTSSRKDEPPPAPGTSSFEVELRNSGHIVTVDPDQTILTAIRAVLPDVLSSCEDGYCGTCETTVLDGIPEHHDDVLSDAERASNQTMMICVGRSQSPRLVLDL